MKKGFTLVELSIVLVIIGLLIGGILIGQSLIQSAKINGLVQQFRQIQVAMEQFKSKYRYFPGDSPLHTPKGDGDGIVESTDMNAGTATWTNSPYDYEVLYVWPHLWQDGFLQDQYDEFGSGAYSGTSVAKGHYPALVMGEGKEVAGATIWTSTGGGLYIRAIDYSGANNRQIQNWADKNCSYTVGEVLAIDAKIDGDLGHDAGDVLAEEHCATYPSGLQSNTSSAGQGGCYDSSG